MDVRIRFVDVTQETRVDLTRACYLDRYAREVGNSGGGEEPATYDESGQDELVDFADADVIVSPANGTADVR